MARNRERGESALSGPQRRQLRQAHRDTAGPQSDAQPGHQQLARPLGGVGRVCACGCLRVHVCMCIVYVCALCVCVQVRVYVVYVRVRPCVHVYMHTMPGAGDGSFSTQLPGVILE